jgi:hypothetical protein
MSAFDDAKTKQQDAQAALDDVHAQKKRAALREVGKDTSAEIAEQAKRTWNKGN